MRELLAFLGLSVPIKYIDQFGMEGVVRLLQKKNVCPISFCTKNKKQLIHLSYDKANKHATNKY